MAGLKAGSASSRLKVPAIHDLKGRPKGRPFFFSNSARRDNFNVFRFWSWPMSDKGKKFKQKPLCFVIGPIGKDSSPERKHSDLLLNAVIKQVLQHEDFGYT
jgi:hypothetical protein